MRYEIDPYNRLVAYGSGRKTGLTGFRRAMDGEFKTDENNTLYYIARSPLSGKETPHQIRLKGDWSLNTNHDLLFTFDKSGRETFGDKLILSGQILDVKENSVLFAITTKTKENTRTTYVLELKGTWKADRQNRLTFQVKKEGGKYDILTFNSAWEVDKNHSLIYRYEKAHLTRKKKKTHVITFKGHWNISDKFRISYILGRGTGSVFNFRSGIGVFGENRIKYEVGVELASRASPIRRTVALYGKWNVKKGLGLTFEVEYENKKMHAMAFGADARLASGNTISFRLKTDMENKDIGVTMRLSREMLKGDCAAFVKLLKSRDESAVYTGAALKW